MTDEPGRAAAAAKDESRPAPRFVVVGPDGSAVPGPQRDKTADERADEGDTPGNPAAMVDQPAKVMRIGTMIKQLLDEVRSAPLDDAARARLAAVHERSLRELEDGLPPDLVAELHRITLPLGEHGTPSDAELRIAQAQLVGWLEGLFHGIQTALVAQQLAAQQVAALHVAAESHQIRGALPPGQYL